MFVIPAIDIKGGKCVRLLKGNFSKQTNYNDSPYDQAKVFSKFGFNYLHLIDLDGALTGKIVNKIIIEQILSIPEIKLQVGGGVRSFEQIDDLFQLGVHNVILGTKAVDDLDFLETACKKFSKKIILSLDVRNGYLALSGWKRQTNISASEFINR